MSANIGTADGIALLQDHRGIPPRAAVEKCVERLRRLAYVRLSLLALLHACADVLGWIVLFLFVVYATWSAFAVACVLDGLAGLIPLPWHVPFVGHVAVLFGAFFLFILVPRFDKHHGEMLEELEQQHRESASPE